MLGLNLIYQNWSIRRGRFEFFSLKIQWTERLTNYDLRFISYLFIRYNMHMPHEMDVRTCKSFTSV